jgi:hypothetical protein
MAKRTRKMLRESKLFLTVLGWRTRKVRERNGRTAEEEESQGDDRHDHDEQGARERVRGEGERRRGMAVWVLW